MAKNDVAFEIFYDNTWHDLVVNDQVLAEQSIVITRGSRGQTGGIPPTVITARLNNADDLLRPGNPESPLYGKAGIGVPVRVSVGGSVRGRGEAASFKSGQTRDFRKTPKRGKAWVDIEAGGTLQRVNQWAARIRSPFYIYNTSITSAPLVGYWPLEDARGTRYAFTPVDGATSGPVTNLAFESQYRPAGSDPLADVDAAPTSTEGYFVPGSAASTAGWQISWVQKLTTFDPAETYSLMFWHTSNNVDWSLLYSAGNWVLTGSNGFSEVVAANINLGNAGWILWNVEASYSGGTTNIEVTYTVEEFFGLGVDGVFGDTYAGPTGTLEKWFVTGLTITDMSVGHVLGLNVTKDVEDLGSDNRGNALAGRVSEQVDFRFFQIFETYLGLPTYINSGTTPSVLMAAQRSGSLPEILAELVATDDALVFDHRTDPQIQLVLRSFRYNQTPFTIDVTELPFPPPDTEDDAGVWNVSKLVQPDGGVFSARDDTGPRGTQAPPDGISERVQPDLAVNIDDQPGAEDMAQHANWWLRRGTVDLPRYPQVTINLAALDAARVAVLQEIDVGDVIEITGYRENTIRLHVLGYTETIGWPNARTLVLNCAPDQQFVLGVWNDDDSRWDLATSTLAVQAGPTATTLTLAMTADEAWSQTSAYDLFIAGEQIGVPVGGMGARTGTLGAYTQTLTGAVRSKNGVRKTLTAGSPVNVATPGRWGL
jgi:hypothetical protein